LRLLLDTHAALWWLSGDERFGTEAEQQIGDTTNQVLLSAAVVWEVAIKRSLGKLKAPSDFAPTLVGAGAQPLPVSLEHAAAVEQLPWHHRDPFDRLLIAQATVERAALVSADMALAAYGIRVVW
jgi:PIN domain nuclease of toxin-antitoxin system